MIRVLLADDQAVVRSGLRTILEAQDGIEVVGEAGDGREAVALARELEPDVVVMDIRMPGLDGIEATRRLAEGPHVLVLTTYGLDEHVYDALRAGAAGFLVKTDSPERIVEGVRVVAGGDALLGPETTRLLIGRFTAGPPPRAVAGSELGLTPREREVLELVAQGLSNAEIAERLVVSDGTVKTHVARILHKLGLRDRVQAVVFAYEHGVVRPGDLDERGRR